MTEMPVTPGEFIIPFGRTYRGQKIKDIPRADLEAYIQKLEEWAQEKRVPLNFEVRLLKKAAELHYREGGS